LTADSSFAADAARTTARILLEIAAVHFRPQQPFILTSGRASPVYIDCRKIISFPRARRKIIELAVGLIEREVGFESLDAVAGGETAGIPFAAWIADQLDLPMLYIRKKPKGFGRGAQIEGDMKAGARCLLVEDLATDGGSKVNFINAIRTAGGTVSHALVVFHYGIFPQSVATLSEIARRQQLGGTNWIIVDHRPPPEQLRASEVVLIGAVLLAAWAVAIYAVYWLGYLRGQP